MKNGFRPPTAESRPWYRISMVEADPSVVDIYIIDFIGDWIDQMMNEMFGQKITITAKAFIDDLEKLPTSATKLRVHINSPGGDVVAATNIANALRDQRATKGRTVETIIEGMAASAASLIAMAGDPVRISDNGLLMIHDPWSRAIGNSREMRKAANELDKFRDSQIVPTYLWHSQLEPSEIVALMKAETWMDANEAIANGFATEKVDGLKAAASISASAIERLAIPEKYRERVQAFVAKDEPELESPIAAGIPSASAAFVLRACREAQCLPLAESLIEAAVSEEEVRVRIADFVTRRTAEDARRQEITALCQTARVPELAEGYCRSGMAISDVRAHLLTLTAKLDQAEIDAHLNPDQTQSSQKAPINVIQVYRDLNKLKGVTP